MLTFDTDVLNKVIAQAKRASAASPRWLNAIERAEAELTTNPYMQQDGDHLIVASPSGNVYSANGVCQCVAYQHGQACWHRAAGRLVQRYTEAQAKAMAAAKAERDIDELF